MTKHYSIVIKDSNADVTVENWNLPILLGSYYKYGTYKCYRPIFLDRTVRIFEKYLRKSEQYV